VHTRRAAKVHVCVCLMSLPKLDIIEESIATDELDVPTYKRIGNLVLVPLILSVLKMLKRKADVVVIRELSSADEVPLATCVGVISGRPSFGVSETGAGLGKFAKWNGIKRAGLVKIRGHRTALGVVAGHLMTLKDAADIVRATAVKTRLPEPVRNAGMRVRSWEREWRRVNL
jgi:deoxyinosine 3'endonuclease (endonuclease V)